MSSAPDIFLSYNREDQATARRFAEGFERAGFSVWWDVTLRSGDDYDKVTEAALKSAKAVVVLWSKRSVESRWVRAEATIADRNHTLVPVMIEACERPIMFELKQTADLTHWKGDTDDAAWLAFVGDVKRLTHKTEPAAALAAPPLTSARLTKRLLSLDLLVAVVIAVGIALSLLLRQGGNGTAPTNAAAPVAAAAADKSIAVLPFANLSTDADQDYFADGLADELINKLSQVRDLQVTGRNSSFYFKGRTSTLSEIGTMLGVGHVLQGSVRKSGTHLRINAQLMNAKSGINEWSQNFDSELTDIFGVQDQIAKAVTVALSVTLGVGEFHRNGMTRNADAYDEYLKGIAATAVNGIPGATAAVEHLQRAVAIDPLFSLGWLKLRDAYFFSITNLPPEQTRDFRDLMVKALQQARMVTPDLPELLLADADEDIRLGNWLAAEKLFRQVMDGNETVSAVANAKYGEMLSEVGRSKDALPYLQRAVRLDPLSADLAANLTKNLLQLGRIDEAVAEADRGIALGDAGRSVFLRALKMLAAYSVDDRVKAAAEVRAGGAPPGPVFAEVADLLVAHKNAEVLSLIKRTIEGDVPPVALAALSLPAQLAGDPALAADLALKRVGTKVLTNPLLHIWLDITAPVRQSPQFKHAVIDSGLLDYWRTTSHWADKCNPVGENDFECH